MQQGSGGRPRPIDTVNCYNWPKIEYNFGNVLIVGA